MFIFNKETKTTNEETKAAKEGMKQKRIKIIYDVAIILVLAVLVTIVSLRYIKPHSEIVATVNGENITKDELYQAMLADGGKQVLERIITNRLIMAEGARLGIEVTDEEIADEIDNMINNNFYGMTDYFYQTLEQYGLTEEALKEDLKTEIVLRKIVLEQINISDEQAREYFSTNQERFNIPEQVKARHILVDSREKAEEVIRLLNNGKDFAELAKEYSKDLVSAEQGGNLGFFQRGEMAPQFEEVAFSLPLNQPSEPVETTYGFHIIEVLDRKAAQKVTFEEVAEKVKKVMSEEMIMEKMSEQVNLLREQASIEYKLE